MRASARRRMALAAVTAALTAAGAAPAAAAPDWNYGLPVDDYEQTCQSIGGGTGFQEEVGTRVRAGQYIDAQDIPKVGEVFYGAVSIAAAGGCSAKSVIPEGVAPAGVELAISAANPVRCHYTLPDGSDTNIVDGCPQAPQTGPHGGFSLSPNGDPNQAWTGIGKVPGSPDLSQPQQETLYIEFPLRSSRPLTGLPGGPSCPDRDALRGPCPRDSAGDFLQVAVQVFALGDSPTLTGAIGTFAEAGSANGTDGTSLVTAPASLHIRSALRGIRITVAVPADGARVTATLSARGIGRIASITRRRVDAGRLSLRLKPTRRAARRLRSRSVTATLSVRVAVPGQAPVSQVVNIRLRR